MVMSKFRLSSSLRESNDAVAVSVLTDYYRPLSGYQSGYTGSQFDRFDPSGGRSASLNTFTSDDLVAVTLLSVRVPGRAAFELLGPQRRRFEVLLEAVGTDRDFAIEDSIAEDDFRPAWDLWRALSELPGLGPTTVSKLMARKRPKLFPIYDSVIDGTVLGGTGVLWAPLHAALRADSFALHKRLLRLRVGAGLDEAVSALRVFDVLSWMDGKGDQEATSNSEG
jgi:hypothetical protein